MSVTGASGIFGYGPQTAKGSVATSFYRHKAVVADLAPIDDVRIGRMEVGSLPTPTFPYKGGIMVAGGVTLQPRLEGDIGWLLLATLGKCVSAPNYIDDGVLTDTPLTVGAQAGYSTGVTDPPSAKAVFVKVITAGDGVAFTGDVTINGTVSGSPDTETISLVDVAAEDRVSGAKLFTEVTSIDLPAWEADGDVLSVGFQSGYQHVFTFDTNPTSVKWLTARRHIPGTSTSNDLGETYEDCKILNLGLNLPGNEVITARMDMLGRKYQFTDSPDTWTWEDDYETFESIPISVLTDGYIYLDTYQSLAVINAALSFANVPLPMTRERIFGSPYLDDITIVNRMLALDAFVKWNDPDLYRKIHTGSISGTEWSGEVFTGSADIKVVAPGYMPNEAIPYSLRVQAPYTNFRLAGGVTLVGDDALMTRYVGTVLDPGSGFEYTTWTLINQQASYVWPT